MATLDQWIFVFLPTSQNPSKIRKENEGRNSAAEKTNLEIFVVENQCPLKEIDEHEQYQSTAIDK